MNRNMFLSVVLLAGCMACASAPSNGGGTNMQLITQQEIEKTNARNAYELVRRLRPSYLTSRGQVTINADNNETTPSVYVNGQLFGTTESLKSIQVSTIAEIRLYHAGEVPAQWEQNNPSGLIAIKTK